jgi:hypothetical protein
MRMGEYFDNVFRECVITRKKTDSKRERKRKRERERERERESERARGEAREAKREEMREHSQKTGNVSFTCRLNLWKDIAPTN